MTPVGTQNRDVQWGIQSVLVMKDYVRAKTRTFKAGFH